MYEFVFAASVAAAFFCGSYVEYRFGANLEHRFDVLEAMLKGIAPDLK